MPLGLDFTENNIAECLKQWKSEDEIWGDLTRAMRHDLKARLTVRSSRLLDM
jgi:hypothetical protein